MRRGEVEIDRVRSERYRRGSWKVLPTPHENPPFFSERIICLCFNPSCFLASKYYTFYTSLSTKARSRSRRGRSRPAGTGAGRRVKGPPNFPFKKDPALSLCSPRCRISAACKSLAVLCCSRGGGALGRGRDGRPRQGWQWRRTEILREVCESLGRHDGNFFLWRNTHARTQTHIYVYFYRYVHTNTYIHAYLQAQCLFSRTA